MKIPNWWYPEMKWPALILAGYILGLNLLIQYPGDPTDFSGLALNCLLIEENSWKYTINTNWGIAFPALFFLLTKLTGSLLTSLRLVGAISSFFAFILLFRISVEQLKIKPDWRFKLGISLLLLSFYYMEMILSVHVDILPITLVLYALFRINGKTTLSFFFSGLIIGLAYWFRFHFLSFAILYPFLVFYIRRSSSRNRYFALASLGGVLVMLIIPHILSYLAYGQMSISNQKAVLDELISGFSNNWACEHQIAVLEMSYLELFQKINILDTIRLFWNNVTSQVQILLVLIVAFSFFIIENKWAKSYKKLIQFSKKETADLLVCFIYIAVCVFPFIYLRGITIRLIAVFMIPIFPYFYKIIASNFRVYGGLVVSIFLFTYWHNATMLVKTIKWDNRCSELELMVSKNIPKSVLQNEPYRVLSTFEYHNPYHRYNLTYPKIVFSWQCRFEPFLTNYERIELQELGNRTLKDQFDYIIFSHLSNDTLFMFPTENIYKQTEILEENEFFKILKVK